METFSIFFARHRERLILYISFIADEAKDL